MVALQLSVEEIEERVLELDMQLMLKMDLHKLYYRYGLDDASRVRAYLEELLHSRSFSPKVTFSQFWRRRRIQLIIVVADMHSVTSHICSVNTTPDLKVLDAVIASISIPVLFTPCSLNGSASNCTFVDGGLINYFLLSVFAQSKIHRADIHVNFNYKKRTKFFHF